MDLKISQDSPALVVQVSGRLDTTTAEAFSRQCEDIIEKGDKNIILDFEHLDYISSAGLRGVLAFTKKLAAIEGTLMLCSLQPLVEEVFKIAGFSSHLNIYPSVEDALSSIQ